MNDVVKWFSIWGIVALGVLMMADVIKSPDSTPQRVAVGEGLDLYRKMDLKDMSVVLNPEGFSRRNGDLSFTSPPYSIMVCGYKQFAGGDLPFCIPIVAEHADSTKVTAYIPEVRLIPEGGNGEPKLQVTINPLVADEPDVVMKQVVTALHNMNKN